MKERFKSLRKNVLDMMLQTNISRSTQGLIALSLLCFILVGLRITVKDEWRFSFLVWNLFLAWIPFWLTSIAAKLQEKTRNRAPVILILAAWLLFFPNSPYIITDLLHIKNYSQNILWFDSLLIFIFAFTGLIIALHSLQKAHELFLHHFKSIWAWALVLACTILAGFGIYLGRYCRLNSWDFLQGPSWFFGRIFQQFENPLTFKVTLTFGFMLFVLHCIFYYFYAPVNSKNSEKVLI